MDDDEIEAILSLTDAVVRYILTDYSRFSEDIEMMDDVLTLVKQVLQCLNMLVTVVDISANDLYLAVQDLCETMISDKEKRFPITRPRGRPTKDIMQEQLSFLIDQG